jgi:hypothetical protein
MIKVLLIQKWIQLVPLIRPHAKKVIIPGLKYHNLKIIMYLNRCLIIKVVYVLTIASLLNLPVIKIVQILSGMTKQNILTFLYVLIIHLTITIFLLK